MKAILLAGGEGSRLRPISAECPKPLVKLCDKPVMEYSIELLKRHDFTDITAALGTMSQKIIDHFGDGSSFGVTFRPCVEEKPLGTAGSVRAAFAQIPAEPLVVLSGDAVTDFDLTDAMNFHLNKNADVTMLLSHQRRPLEFGLVMMKPDGRVTQIVEKPSWKQVFSNLVNTGIYILSPAALKCVPENTFFDFAKDLFPHLLAGDFDVFGYAAEGYWCDMGDAGAYLRVCRDMLSGKVRLTLPPQGSIPANVTVSAPCYIAPDAAFGKGVKLGAYTVVGAGSILGDGVVCDGGVIQGGILEAGSRCEGAYIGKGAVLGKGAVAREGAVVADGARIGDDAELLETARIWPRKEIPAHCRVSGAVARGNLRQGTHFSAGGQIIGQPHVDLSPDFCFRLGAAAASCFPGETAVAHQGGEAAKIVVGALQVGIAAAGNRPVETDAETPACAGFCGGLYHIPLSLFVRQSGRDITIFFYGADGLPLARADERRLEAAVLRGDLPFADPDRIAAAKRLMGLGGLYAYTASLPPVWGSHTAPRCFFNVAGQGKSADHLRAVLASSGAGSGTGATLTIDENGLQLTATLEDGRVLQMPRLCGMVALAEVLCGAKRIALPADAPLAIEDMAQNRNVFVLREGRDGKAARELLAAAPFMRDPVCMAARLSYALRALGTTLDKLDKALPPFYLVAEEVDLQGERSRVMQELLNVAPPGDLRDGLTTKMGGVSVRIHPVANRRALRIVAEGQSVEMAQEICTEFSRRARVADRQ